jgi:hypothetical protein
MDFSDTCTVTRVLLCKAIPIGVGPLGLSEFGAARNSRHSAHEGGKVTSLCPLPPFPSPGASSAIHFC